MKNGLQIILFIGNFLSGQNEENWSVSLPVIDRVVSIDTLGTINHKASGKVLISRKKQFIRGAAMAGTIILGSLAWKIQQDADKQFENYLHSGDPQERQAAWDRTRYLDKASGSSVVGSQFFMQLLIYSYIDDH